MRRPITPPDKVNLQPHGGEAKPLSLPSVCPPNRRLEGIAGLSMVPRHAASTHARRRLKLSPLALTRLPFTRMRRAINLLLVTIAVSASPSSALPAALQLNASR